MSMENQGARIVVIGGGAWGTAIALSLCARRKADGSLLDAPVTLWLHSKDEADAVEAARENVLFLPGFKFPEHLKISCDDAVVGDADVLVSVIPSAFLRSTTKRLAKQFKPGQMLVSATKGIEDKSALRMTELIVSAIAEVQPGLKMPVGALSGPSFAQEVAEGLPTAVTVAFEDAAVAALVQHLFTSPALRLYSSTDVVGVELGGALKNIIAIASGISSGMGLGYNSAAGLITRGIAEITRLAVACGAKRETLAGLSGVGDLVLTCTGSLSRNRTVGVELGKGRKLPEILESLGGKVAEGVPTTRAALELARKHNIEMPITEQMERILDEGKDPRVAMKELMQRPNKDE
jgi:glycerol-3-phosphate dehydrogenase (NAD(P)+)